VKITRTLVLLALICAGTICNAAEPIWPAAKATAWYREQGWLVGANFLPSTAINQLEMWQADTFDPQTIDRELGWAEGIGMNVMRVYLHDLAWKADPVGFKRRMSEFLAIASRHRIKILFTLFDDCWNPDARVGKQPEPKPGVHNSGWVRSPNKAVHDDPSQWGYLEEFNSRFTTHLPIFKRYGVGAINWGLVSGKSNTIFPWGSKEGSPEPTPWFHDVFRRDGTPYDPVETSLIKELTARKEAT